MTVIIVGATGTIGSAVCDALASHHEVVTVGHKRGAFHVDIVARHARRYRGTGLSRERRTHGDWVNHRPSQCRGEVTGA